MQKLVLVTRPIEQATEFAEQVSAAGFTPLIQPLLDIDYLSVDVRGIHLPAAIILSSRQSVKNVEIPVLWHEIPVFCVGDMTEQAAQMAGFANTIAGQGNLTDLLPLVKARIPAGQSLLYLRGENVSHDLKLALPDYAVEERITYRAVPIKSLPADVIERFAQIDVITLFSARSGAILKQFIHENGLISHVKTINLLCLSPSVVESMVEMGWGACVMSDLPNQMSMIEKLKSL
jgi:uroporphyrinogen-III synthase